MNIWKDEFQFTCVAWDVDKLQYNIDNCIRVAGEYFEMECPLASDSMIGRNWYHTH
ncbi:DNA polymerase [Vibrio phage vB_VpaP_SJSY21]|nr:DNA polymerase [Vibrio phage vB_VpaP_SJSY21]